MAPVKKENGRSVSASQQRHVMRDGLTYTFISRWFIQTQLSCFFFFNLVEPPYNFL
jgi:hypothetical protein